MQDIHELIRVLEQHRIRFPQPTLSKDSDETLLVRLFEGVRTGQYTTDNDAATDIFPGASADHSGYYETRAVLRDRLSGAIEQFVSDLEQFPDLQRAHIECQKLWLNVRTLSGQNAAEFSLFLAAHLLRIAAKFDFTLLAMDVAMYLRLQKCMRDHQGDLCTEADARYDYYRHVLDAEFQAEKMYTDITALSVAGRASAEEVRHLAYVYTETLAPVLAKYSSAKLHLYGNLVEWQWHLAAYDYVSAMRQCERAIQFFLNKPFHARDPLQVFQYQMLLCCIHLRNIEAGERAARSCLELSVDNMFNRFKIKELLLLLYLHAKHYDKAFTLFVDVTSDAQFVFLPGSFRSNWAIFQPYLSFLTTIGLVVHASPNVKGLSLSPVDRYSSTSALLIIEFITLLQKKQYDEARTHVSELKHFSFGLQHESNIMRSALFVQMLLQIPEGDFQRSKAERLAGHYLTQLHTVPLVLANQTHELEVLPFEDLWEFVLQCLEA